MRGEGNVGEFPKTFVHVATSSNAAAVRGATPAIRRPRLEGQDRVYSGTLAPSIRALQLLVGDVLQATV